MDIFFAISGFLLVYKLLQLPLASTPTVGRFLASRWLRIFPCIIVVALVGLYLGDAWDEPYRSLHPASIPPWLRILSVLGLINNYLPSWDWGSYVLSPTWSCLVDLHAGLLILSLVVIIKAWRRKTKPPGERGGDATATATITRTLAEVDEGEVQTLWWLLAALVALSVGIRACLFEKDSVNLILLGNNYSHFGVLQPTAAYAMLQSPRYNRE